MSSVPNLLSSRTATLLSASRNPQILIKWTARAASGVKEATTLIEAGFEYVTGDYSDGGKIFRKRK